MIKLVMTNTLEILIKALDALDLMTVLERQAKLALLRHAYWLKASNECSSARY